MVLGLYTIFMGSSDRDLWPTGAYTPVSLLITIGFVLLVIGVIL